MFISNSKSSSAPAYLRSAKISFRFVTASFLLSGIVAFAEPPAVTTLFPAGIQQGTTAELKLTGKPGAQPVSVWTATDGLGEFKFSEKGDTLTLTASAETKPGLHWIRFYNPEGTTSLLPIIVGALPEKSETEPNNSTSDAKSAIELPTVVNGILHKGGEVDTFAVTLVEGETLIASVDALAALGSPMDSALQILNSDGFVLAHNDDDHGFDPLIAFTAPQDGNYFVRVFCFPSAPNSTINFAGGATYVYRLSLTTGPFISQGAVNNFGPIGWNFGDSSKEPSTATAIPQLITFAPEVANTDAAIIEQDNTAAIKVPSEVFGTISQLKEVDQFSISVKKGDAFRIRIHARSIASHLDPVLKIRKADKSLIKENDDIAARENLDIDFAWKAPADGDYIFEISDRYNHAGSRYYYRMIVTPDEPRLELTVSADHFKAKRDKPLVIPVTISRLAGFKSEIMVSIQGGPEGMVAAPVRSEPKGDSAKKVALKVDVKDAAAYTGPIKIVATHGDEKIEILARTALKLKKQTTSHIWLTVPPKPAQKAEPKPEE